MANSETTITLVKNPQELEIAYEIRREVFMREGDEPEEEQFDGNDFCAAHLLAYWKGKPAGTMRLRVVSGANGGTIMWERLAVPKETREQNPWLFRFLLNAARQYTEMMGLHTIIGIVENEKLMRFYKRYGFRPTGEPALIFRGHEYIPMFLHLDEAPDWTEPTLKQAVMAFPDIFDESRKAA